MKIHCAQLVEGALRSALAPETVQQPAAPVGAGASTLVESLKASSGETRKVKIVPKSPPSA
jgi:hypothetical protein